MTPEETILKAAKDWYQHTRQYGKALPNPATPDGAALLNLFVATQALLESTPKPPPVDAPENDVPNWEVPKAKRGRKKAEDVLTHPDN